MKPTKRGPVFEEEEEKKTRIDLDPTKAIRWQYIIVTREPGEMPPFGLVLFNNL